MILLVLGVLLWSTAHLFKAAAPPLRQSLVDRLGADAWRGLFSLVILASLVLMVLGWRSAPLDQAYLPPIWARHLTMTAMLVSLVLFAAAGMPSNFKRRLRHPQLTGVLVWSLGHLAANGELRSVVLFGGIGLWALVEIPLINRRDGAWRKPGRQPRSADVRAVLGGVIAFVALYFAHPFLFGVSPM
jgi:uncharacterized membrane protein